MNLTLKDKLSVFLVLFLMLTFIILFPKEELSNNVKIGVSDDTSGLVIDYIIKNKSLSKFEKIEEYESYFISDC